MSQVAVASVQSRIGGVHSSVIYYQEIDVDVQPATDEELAELCRLAQEQTVNLSDDQITDLIDSPDPNGTRKVFM